MFSLTLQVELESSHHTTLFSKLMKGKTLHSCPSPAGVLPRMQNRSPLPRELVGKKAPQEAAVGLPRRCEAGARVGDPHMHHSKPTMCSRMRLLATSDNAEAARRCLVCRCACCPRISNFKDDKRAASHAAAHHRSPRKHHGDGSLDLDAATILPLWHLASAISVAFLPTLFGSGSDK